MTLSITRLLTSSKAIPSSLPRAVCSEPHACWRSLLELHPYLRLSTGKPNLSVSPFPEAAFCVFPISKWCESPCCHPRQSHGSSSAFFWLTSAVPTPVDSSSPAALTSVLFFPFLSAMCCLSPEPLECFSFCHHLCLKSEGFFNKV